MNYTIFFFSLSLSLLYVYIGQSIIVYLIYCRSDLYTRLYTINTRITSQAIFVEAKACSETQDLACSLILAGPLKTRRVRMFQELETDRRHLGLGGVLSQVMLSRCGAFVPGEGDVSFCTGSLRKLEIRRWVLHVGS